MACSSDDTALPPDVVDNSDDVCETDRTLPSCTGSDDVIVVPPVNNGGSGGGGVVDPPEEPTEFDLERAVAENVLRVNCGQCHGSDLDARVAQAEMNYIDDIDALIENGKVVPLRPGQSPIVQYMLDGTMPPPGVAKRPTAADIQTVVRFIENPDFWPGYDPPEPARDCSDQIIEFDDLYLDLQSDLIRQEADNREFIRYLTLTNRYNAGVCVENLDPDRWAISKLIKVAFGARYFSTF
jgi:mono/diheme cytochrome c family protein